jgi:hypothetical protein
MHFRTAALLAALAIVPTCAEHLKIPNERPDISSTVENNIIARGDGGGGNGGVSGDAVVEVRGEKMEALLASGLSLAAPGVGKARKVGGGNIRCVNVSPALIGSIDLTWKSIAPLFLGW